MKRVEVLIVDDMKGSTKVDETQITELLKQINEKVDKVVINKGYYTHGFGGRG
jgi:hypothetical protein